MNEYGPYHPKELLGIKLTNEEFDYFICEQNKGKELKVLDGKIVAVDPIPTEEEILQHNLFIKIKRLEELTKDFAQVQAGLIIEDIEDRKVEFQTLLNEVRVLQGKEPRLIQGTEQNESENENNETELEQNTETGQDDENVENNI